MMQCVNRPEGTITEAACFLVNYTRPEHELQRQLRLITTMIMAMVMVRDLAIPFVLGRTPLRKPSARKERTALPSLFLPRYHF